MRHPHNGNLNVNQVFGNGRGRGCIPVIASGTSATGAAERQDVRSRGWSAAEPPESKSCGPCRVAASQSPDGRDRGAATRLLLVSARDRGLRCAPPPAIRFTPLRGGLSDDSHHPARSLMRRNGNASVERVAMPCRRQLK